MDPKSLPSLDPKLKEAYERVMATSLPANNGAAPTPPPSPAPHQVANPVSPQSVATPPPPTPVISEPLAPKNVEPAATYVASQSVSTSIPGQSATSSYVTSAGTVPVGKSRFSPVILIVAGAIFFVVYTLFWLRFFNVSLPFLP